MIRKYNEIRLNEKGNLDDIAIFNVHLERMDDKFWWLGIYRDGKKLKRVTFHITSKSKIEVHLIENELNTKIVPYKKP